MPYRQDHGRTGEASLRTEQAIDELICDRIEQAYAFALAHRSNDDDAMFMLYAMHAAIRTRDAIANAIDIDQSTGGGHQLDGPNCYNRHVPNSRFFYFPSKALEPHIGPSCHNPRSK
jgi:hypothetical protein